MTLTSQIQPFSEIVPGIYHLQLPLADSNMTGPSHVNSYFIRGSKGWLLIDPGWNSPHTLHTLEQALKELNLSMTDIETVFVTHCHPDHFGMAGKIKQLSPKTHIMMHSWEAGLTKSRYIQFSDLQDMMHIMLAKHGVPHELLKILGMASMPAIEFVTFSLPDRILFGGEIIQTGEFDLEVIWTPGHSPGHVCLYEPQNKLLFSGDHVLPSISPNISYHVLSGDNPLGDYLYAMSKLSHLSVSQVHPGHEYSFTGLQDRIQAILEHHNQREKEIIEILDSKILNCYQIASGLHWNLPGFTWDSFPPLEKRLAITETIAHVEHLRWNGKVYRNIKDNCFLYSLV
jgi:glyoxylase-like metal-dependent hydrolase (beta-lactamase superfamily II)